MSNHITAAALALIASLSATGLPADWSTSWDGTLYGYAEHLSLAGDSVLNPGNSIAGLSEDNATAEGRFNLEAENDSLRLMLRPILVTRSSPAFNQPKDEAYLSQWQARLRLDDAWSAAVGREVLNWGPAQFRSPSSPYYFFNGRGDPLRELSGIDDFKLSWTPDRANTLALAYVAGSGHDTDLWEDSWLLKADHRADDWAGGLALQQSPGQGLFIGAHGRYTYSDALLLYAEGSSSTRADALVSVPDPEQPFELQARSSRQFISLIGAAYTFENGQTVNAEYLHNGHGYDEAEQRTYFERAAASPILAGLALAQAPPLLGRDYLYLVWQSNLMETDGYWRLMFTHQAQDGGNELAGYVEHSLNDHLSLFAFGRITEGGARSEFGALIEHSLTLGIKIAIP